MNRLAVGVPRYWATASMPCPVSTAAVLTVSPGAVGLSS
jgi:hypothetical protein